MNMTDNKKILQRITFPGKIHLIQNDQQLHTVESLLNSATEFGFDTETKPSFKKGDVFKVALLQLATDTDAYVIRLHHIKEFHLIKSIFEKEKVIKVGVAIRDDLMQLQKVFKFDAKNCFELQTLAKNKGLKNFGIKGMTEEILEATVSKGSKMTNWENSQLTEQQIMYAATDAWIGLKLYKKLISI